MAFKKIGFIPVHHNSLIDNRDPHIVEQFSHHESYHKLFEPHFVKIDGAAPLRLIGEWLY